jgi:hypothetical protein
MANDGFVTIHRTIDLAQGELLAEMLRREGIEARFHKISSTLIGIPASMIEMTVDVPAESEARARELIAELEYVGASEAADEPAGKVARAPRARRPVLAAGFALFLPGGGHLYARRSWTALVLALGWVACLGVVIAARRALEFEFAVAILIATVLSDAVAGVRAARAEGRGERLSPARQLARGLGLLGIAIVLGGGARFVTTAPRRSRSWELENYRLSCTTRSITVENRGAEERVVEISQLKVAMTGRQELYDIPYFGSTYLNLGAGERDTVRPGFLPMLALSCPLGETDGLPDPLQPKPCDFVFDFKARPRGDQDSEPLHATGFCRPPAVADREASGELLFSREE